MFLHLGLRATKTSQSPALGARCVAPSVLIGLLTHCGASLPEANDVVPEDTARPNVVFLYTDDQGAWTTGHSGNTDARTPNLDRIFREGAYLTNSFTTTPVCSPSRASLMVSRYGTELGITDYLNHSREPDLGLDPATLTWPEVLQASGYVTGLFGKWHLGQLDRYHPTASGYDEFSGFRTGGRTSKDPDVEIDGEVRRVEGYTPDILTDFAIDFVRRNVQSSRDRPFLVNVHYWAPHANSAHTPDDDRTWLPLSDADWTPFQALDPIVPDRDYPNLDIPRVKRMMREYLGSIASVDRNVGRLLDVLDELGLTSNTILIFSSDHGYNMGHHGIWHKGNGRWILTNNRGPRPNMFDRSLRVPAAVRWPAVIQPGTVVDQTTTNLDWYPTILAAAGAELPHGELVRGRDILPLLKGENPVWDNDLYAEYDQHHFSVADQRTYRTPEWKLIRDFTNPGKDEFYHLADDPSEHHNLIDSPDPEVISARKELAAKLAAKMDAIR